MYDVTTFKRHPGQYDILVGSSMKDATHSFNTVNHSAGAVRGLKKYYIGDFDMYTLPDRDLTLAGHGVENWFLWALLMFSIFGSLQYVVYTYS